MDMLKHIVNNTGTFHSRAEASSHGQPRAVQEVVAKLPVQQLMEECERVSENFQAIHMNILNFYRLHGSVSDTQADTMRAFLLTNGEADRYLSPGFRIASQGLDEEVLAVDQNDPASAFKL